MPSGIRATVEFRASDLCPIVELSATEDTTIFDVHSNICPSEHSESVIEFSLDSDCEPDGDISPIFSFGATDRYRITTEQSSECPCECLSRFDCPVVRYVARKGTLTLVFHAADYDQLQAVVAELRARFPSLDIKRFIRSPASEESSDTVLVDRSKLTARQLEILDTAHEMGYFDRPRRANATEIAAEFDITPSTLREHLATAQGKLLDDVL
jgi:hypothetical protein